MKGFFKQQSMLLVLGIIILVAVLSYKFYPKIMGPKKAPVLVQVQPVKTAPIDEKIFAVGNLAALQDIYLSSQVTGYVTKIAFTDGQMVKAGDLLFQLDNSKEQAEVVSKQADYQQAADKYNRMQSLVKGHYVAAQDVETARADVQAKLAALKSAQDNFNKKTITAPFGGVVGAKMVTLGDCVSPGLKLVELVDRNALKVAYSVPEKYLAKIKPEQTVAIIPADVSNKQYLGKVVYIAPSIDPQTHTINLQAYIPNFNNELAPGLFVQVQQLIRSNPQAILVSEEALVKSPDKTVVYRILDNKAVATVVQTGTSQDGMVEILSGLSPTDSIVIAGQEKLSDGDLVQVVK